MAWGHSMVRLTKASVHESCLKVLSTVQVPKGNQIATNWTATSLADARNSESLTVAWSLKLEIWNLEGYLQDYEKAGKANLLITPPPDLLINSIDYKQLNIFPRDSSHSTPFKESVPQIARAASYGLNNTSLFIAQCTVIAPCCFLLKE